MRPGSACVPARKPTIVGTGFPVGDKGVVAANRHVAEALKDLPPHPATGQNGYAAVMFEMGKEDTGDHYMRWTVSEIASVGMRTTLHLTLIGTAKPFRTLRSFN